jgi:hypothetical protein
MAHLTVGDTWEHSDGEPGDHVVVLDAGDYCGDRVYLHRVRGGWWFSLGPDRLSDPFWASRGHPWAAIKAPSTSTFTVVRVAE